jgi:hypothetical protein
MDLVVAEALTRPLLDVQSAMSRGSYAWGETIFTNTC